MEDTSVASGRAPNAWETAKTGILFVMAYRELNVMRVGMYEKYEKYAKKYHLDIEEEEDDAYHMLDIITDDARALFGEGVECRVMQIDDPVKTFGMIYANFYGKRVGKYVSVQPDQEGNMIRTWLYKVVPANTWDKTSFELEKTFMLSTIARVAGFRRMYALPPNSDSESDSSDDDDDAEEEPTRKKFKMIKRPDWDAGIAIGSRTDTTIIKKSSWNEGDIRQFFQERVKFPVSHTAKFKPRVLKRVDVCKEAVRWLKEKRDVCDPLVLPHDIEGIVDDVFLSMGVKKAEVVRARQTHVLYKNVAFITN